VLPETEAEHGLSGIRAAAFQAFFALPGPGANRAGPVYIHPRVWYYTFYIKTHFLRGSNFMLRRILPVFLAAILLLAAGCGKPAGQAGQIRIGGLTGPTSMGMVKVMESAKDGDDYVFTIAGSADELTLKLIQGDLDLAAIPANLASVLYNNTEGEIVLLAVNTLGVLYIVEKGDTVNSFSDLRGKTIYATGKGSVPEYVLKYLLTGNGIDPENDVSIRWKSEPAEVVALMGEEGSGIAMLPQPYVTVAKGQLEGLRVCADLTEEWEKLDNGSVLITGVLAARKEFVDKHPDELEKFLREYSQSVEFVNSEVAQAARLIEEFGIFKAAVAEKAIPECNITYMAGEKMKSAVQGYLKVLFDQNPKAVGGSLPGNDFYYEE